MSSKYDLMRDEDRPGGYAGPVNTNQPTSFGATTTVIVTQPTHGGRQWTSGMCDCCSDCETCICGYFCGLCQACALAKKLEENGMVACCGATGLVAMRTKYRMKHGIQGTMMSDIWTSVCCYSCAQCQLARDMKVEMYPKTCCGMC